ncbi:MULTISPECIES: universal stress protein [unclassified Flavobacterium]|uniref:universal stress protein n=1 Tax=unclassified Flavobacterium TaxID=196869 RepID=UPI002354EB14|nr:MULTISPECIES: universal stress protein [unclassified Flavobacterium]
MMNNANTITIIAATNFSAIAENAVLYAAGLAKTVGAKLLLFNSFSLPVHSANSHITSDGIQKLIDNTTNKLKRQAETLAQQFGIETTVFCSYSFLEEQLVLLLKETNAQLLVMGMAERSLEQTLIGNSTTSAIKNINIPILAVPLKAHFEAARKILFACDTFKEVPLKKLSWLWEATKLIDGEIEVFNVTEKIDNLKASDAPALAKNIAESEFQDVRYLYKSVRSNAVIAEIEKEIRNFDADILVMIPQKYGFWDSLIHRSKTGIMASGLNIPLLSLPNY